MSVTQLPRDGFVDDLQQAMTARRPSLRWWAVPPLMIACLFALLFPLWSMGQAQTSEGHLLENLQLVFLTVALLYQGRQWHAAGRGPLRVYQATLAVLCASVLLREWDVAELGAAALWPLLETMLRGVALLGWLLIAWMAYRWRKRLWRLRRAILTSNKSLCIYAAILCYVASWPFDKDLVALTPGLAQFIEEFLQIAGTTYFLASALADEPVRRQRPTATGASSQPHQPTRQAKKNPPHRAVG